MAQLRQDESILAEAGIEAVIVGPEKPEAFQRFWTVYDIPFVGLPDPTHKVLNLFGQQVNLFKLGRMPAQVLVDKGGIVRFAHYGHSMTDIPSAAEVIAALSERADNAE